FRDTPKDCDHDIVEIVVEAERAEALRDAFGAMVLAEANDEDEPPPTPPKRGRGRPEKEQANAVANGTAVPSSKGAASAVSGWSEETANRLVAEGRATLDASGDTRVYLFANGTFPEHPAEGPMPPVALTDILQPADQVPPSCYLSDRAMAYSLAKG